MAVYEKAGFRREGVFREFLPRDGQLHDMYLYGLLRREWEADRKPHLGAGASASEAALSQPTTWESTSSAEPPRRNGSCARSPWAFWPWPP